MSRTVPSIADRRSLLANSATKLGPAGGAVVFCGSHGGRFSAACALAAGVGGIVLNDAGVGRDRAGIAGLDLLDDYGVPAATVDRATARIGLAADTAAGTLSHVNATAAALGVGRGMRAAVFAERVATMKAPRVAPEALPQVEESRTRLRAAPLSVWAIDSASLARPTDAGSVLVTGSHAQLVGGDARNALSVDARVAVFNDAGGIDVPSRLDALDDRGIAAVAVAASTARIGDACSSYFDGVISAVNDTAAAGGAAVAIAVAAYVTRVAERAKEEATR